MLFPRVPPEANRSRFEHLPNALFGECNLVVDQRLSALSRRFKQTNVSARHQESEEERGPAADLAFGTG